MTPFKLILIVTWLIPNPAAPTDKTSVITEVFPDRQICEVARDEEVSWYLSIHENVRAEGFCIPARTNGA
jgi:hypothetical protein